MRSGLYGLGDVIVSLVLPELQLTVDDIFPELWRCKMAVPDETRWLQ